MEGVDKCRKFNKADKLHSAVCLLVLQYQIKLCHFGDCRTRSKARLSNAQDLFYCEILQHGIVIFCQSVKLHNSPLISSKSSSSDDAVILFDF